MIAGVADTHTALWQLFDDKRLSATAVNLRLLGSNRRGGIFLLAALVSTGSPPATAGCCAAPVPG